MTQPTKEMLCQEAQRFFCLAERDASAFRVLKDASDIHLSTVCFHAQQAVEKYLKSVIIQQGFELRKTHDLEAIYYILSEHGIVLPVGLEELGKLNPYAVTFRYDDMDIELLTRNEAENIMNTVRDWVENYLNKENY
ncbi:MAG: HEPN domain-containing protein [Candidatus Marithrix sp.]